MLLQPLLAMALCLATLIPPVAPGTVKVSTFQLGLSNGLFTDRKALLALKAIIPPGGFGTSLISAGWPTGTDPAATQVNPCLTNATWPHITCDSQPRVTTINLAGLGITGVNLPGVLSTMDYLQTLDLSNNKFSGPLPETWGGEQAFLRLEKLDLSYNWLSGSLPDWNQRKAFPKLSELYLQYNLFEGALPTAWAGANRPLRMLTVLDVSFNYLGRQDNPAAADGFDYLPLPDSTDDWGKADRFKTPFPRLKTLDLGSNYFTGSLPNWGKQYAFPALRDLYLDNNTFTGALPASWGAQGAFSNLRVLKLQWNNLGDSLAPGVLPSSWTKSTSPRAFPALQTMVLFNGNSYICGAENTLAYRLQGEAAYTITDSSGVVYEPETANFRLC